MIRPCLVSAFCGTANVPSSFVRDIVKLFYRGLHCTEFLSQCLVALSKLIKRWSSRATTFHGRGLKHQAKGYRYNGSEPPEAVFEWIVTHGS